jgi:hypothetical protein
VKYLIIGHKFGALGRGGYHVSKRFCDEHSEYCEFLEDKKARNLEELGRKHKRIIFRTQVPRCYSIPVNFVRVRKINHIFYLRSEHIVPFYNNCTNGFHYYRNHEGFDNYIPMITDFPVEKLTTPNEICLGFYVRKWLTPDSFDCFIDTLNNMPYKINVAIMGDPNHQIRHHPKVDKFLHTNDNVKFFSTITHYFYPTSKRFVDPFPHSVIEALQCGKTLIFPTIERTHKDGIDDIKDCIWWTNINEKFIEDHPAMNQNHPFKAKLWKKFYHKVFENNWEFGFDRNKYKSMYDFVKNEVI